MKKTSVRVHSVPALFSLLLFGLFALFLLMMLLFSARAYQQETVFSQTEDSLILLLHMLLQNSVSMILLEESLLIN